jgi:hypothetical protein
MSSGADVLKMIKDKKVKFIDFRFTDTKGKEQHVSVPASTDRADTFEHGKMFDGSSIAGWKGIQESDMILMPAAGHRGHGPVHGGTDPDPALRRGRALHHAGLRALPAFARQACRGLPQEHRRRRHRLLRPRGRVLHLRRRALGRRHPARS